MPEDFSSVFPAFAFDGVAQHRRGWRAPVAIRVSPPQEDRPSEYVCAVSCYLVEELARPVRSSTPAHAYALTFCFLRFTLSPFDLFDSDGAPFHLPRIPPEVDDWVIPDRAPEQGFRIHAHAVGPDGVIHPFADGVSAPQPVEEGYAAEVRYGAKEPAALVVRGDTPAKAYDAGVAWIRDRFDSDRLTLLGLWNEPIELPSRVKT